MAAERCFSVFHQIAGTIVDDSRSVRALIAERAVTTGWRIREAACAEDAIAAAAASPPDVIVLDHDLPGMSGVDAIPQLRSDGYGGPILLFTRFLTDTIPGIKGATGVWPVSKADLDGMLTLLGAYRSTAVGAPPTALRAAAA